MSRRPPETWAVVLAAGEGKRMRSARAKVLHPLAGRPLVQYSIDLARAVAVRGLVVVVGHQGEAVRAALAGQADVDFVEQPAPRGTGHALAVARGAVPAGAAEVLLLYADVPLLEPATVERLLARHRATRAAATVLTFTPADPTGYGRIVRAGRARRDGRAGPAGRGRRAGRGGGPGRVRAIVEERDATAAERRLRECNSGIYVFDPRALWPVLDRLAPDNDQGEYYLTDVIARLARRGRRVESVGVDDPREVAGVNDRRQLAELEGVLRGRTLERLMLAGVTVRDPASTYVDATVKVGRDTVLHPGVALGGGTVIGEGCEIGAGCQLVDAVLGDGVTLRPYCVLDRSTVEADATLGPFARLRAGSAIGAGAEIGNFIEIKKSTVGRRVKAHHVGYLGDATVGEGANIGAGAITCNYDGRPGKLETRIGARAFVGTHASLIAPLTIGDEAFIGAGSVIDRDVPPGALAVARAPQVIKEGWSRRRRARAGGEGDAPAPSGG